MTYNSRPKQVLQIPLDKLLFAIASLYFGLTVLWVFTHQNRKLTPGVTTDPESSSHQESIAHLEKSLETIDRKTADVQTAKPSPQPPSVAPVIRVAPPPPPPIANPSTPPVERIYIPVYPQNPPRPQTVTTSPVPPPPPVVAVAPPQPIQTHFAGGKLVGVLELGDHSSALFDVNGLTKRVAIGENVNGWVLLKVQDQQVFLYRGNTTRVLDLGQSL